MSLRILLAFLVCCIMLRCSRTASSTPTAEAIDREEDTAEAATTTKTPTTEPTQPPATCNRAIELEIDRSKPILGDIPMVPDHNIQVLLLNRRFVPRKTCKELYNDGFNKSGLYIVKPCQDMSEFVVYCDMNLQGGGWTIIQRRVNNNLSFRRDYKSYQNGFGDFTENFWLGLDKIYCLTNSSGLNNGNATYELYIGLESFFTEPVQFRWAKYGSFGLGEAADGYKLSIGQYDSSSTAGDALYTHNGERFSTPDNDVDSLAEINCAEVFKSGWWFHDCYDSNLNGIYYEDGVHPTSIYNGIIWSIWLGNTISLKTVVMALRQA